MLVAIAVAVTTAAIAISKFQGSRKSRDLRISLNYETSGTKLDPLSLVNIYEYELMQNLYGRLVRYDQNGQLVADIPTSFSWSDRQITFVFGRKAITLSGHVIDAADAAISLRRLISSGKREFEDIRNLLCQTSDKKRPSKNLSEACAGIQVKDDRLILTVDESEHVSKVLTLIESAQFSILPRYVINEATGELKDRSHIETSGPYWLSKDSPDGRLELKANPKHYLFNEHMPQRIETFPGGGKVACKMLMDGKIDFLPASTYLSGELASQVVKNRRFNIHETLPFRVLLVRFSPQALLKFTAEQKLYAGLKAIQAFQKHYGQVGGRPTSQFFQSLSDGTLLDEQLAEINRLRDALKPKFQEPITYGAMANHFETLTKELSNEPDIKVVDSGVHPMDLPVEKQPDMYYLVTDSAWTENLSLLGYNFESKMFWVPGLDTSEWMRKYVSKTDKGERIAMLRDLHFNMLKNGSIVPVEMAPYYVISTKDWELNQLKLLASTLLWTVRRK